MTLPTTQPSSATIGDPYLAISEVIRAGQRIKAGCDNAVMQLQGGPSDSYYIFTLLNNAAAYQRTLTDLKAAPGLDQAAILIPGYGGTLTNDLQATINAIQAVIDWILNNVPTSGGFVLAYKWQADGKQVGRVFQPAATAGLVTQINALKGTIA